MRLVDVNVLIYAHREEAQRHTAYKCWLTDTLQREGLGLTDLVLSGFVRVVTHARILTPPTPLDLALTFVTRLRTHANTTVMVPGPRHWDIFVDLLRHTGCRGNLVSDAFHAALAIEYGCEWITTDRDFARFPKLKWRHPLDA